MPTDPMEKYSRQVLLPSVGAAIQQKWLSASILLCGEGPALESAATALSAAGLTKLFLDSPPGAVLDLPVQRLSGGASWPPVDLVLCLSTDAAFRRKVNRGSRKEHESALFGWTAAGGFALFGMEPDPQSPCPCFECFEILNPKAFGKGSSAVSRALGAAAASEALLWIAEGGSPLKGVVWLNSLDSGLAVKHHPSPSHKCPAKLADQGVKITP